MNNYFYWVIALTLAVVLLIVLINEYRNNNTPDKLNTSFQRMTGWVIFFCLQDAFWGLCDSKIITNETIFFISSEIFHLSTVLTTFFWLYYILVFLGEKIKHKKLFLAIDMAVIFCEFILVILNIFKPILFTIQNGHYIPGSLRPFTFINQYIVYFLIGIITLICSLKEKTPAKKRYFTVFIFALFPVLLGAFQLLFVDGPFYSMGYFLGCFVVHIFIVGKDRTELAQNKILKSLADIYYSMHIINLEEKSVEKILESRELTTIFENLVDPQQMLDDAMNITVCEEYTDIALNFVKLATLSERLKNRSNIFTEIVGRNYGWVRFSFIVIERSGDKLKKVMFATQIIDEEKKNQIALIYKSNHDELTGLYNRNSYQDEINKKNQTELEDNLVYVSMDLNELKNVNDTLGHAVGDEILKGAAQCMKNSFGLYGKIFRVGGDEFSALINASPDELEKIKADFEDNIIRWSGKFIDHLSVSTGYVLKTEVPHGTLAEMSELADQRMYRAKTEFYRTKGLDRRGQKDAHIALTDLYTKILKINITNDSYQIINMDVNEQNKEMGFESKISEWLKNFAETGCVHSEDKEEYLSKTDFNYIYNYFASGKKLLCIHYRRKYQNDFKQVVMDIIPANDYSPENQSFFLYVKSIE